MKRKNLISLTIAFAFLALSITGILLYVKQKAHFIEITHTLMGLLFVGFAIFHIINNWSSITGYSKGRAEGGIKKEFWVAGGIFAVIFAGGLSEVLEPVAEAGRIFAKKRPPRAETISFEEVKADGNPQGVDVELFVRKGEKDNLQTYAIVEVDSAKNEKIIYAPTGYFEGNEEEIKEKRAKIVNTSEALKMPNLNPTTEAMAPNGDFVLKTKFSLSSTYKLVGGNLKEITSKEFKLSDAQINTDGSGTFGKVFLVK